MEHDDNRLKKSPAVYSKTIRAGRRRTYFFDVRTTKANDFYITLTESKKKFNDDGYERHKIFLYKEDFNKFVEALSETINHVKQDLLPEYDFDEFNNREYDEDDDYHDDEDGHHHHHHHHTSRETPPSSAKAEEPTKAEDEDSAAEEPVAKVNTPTSSASESFDEEDLKWD